MEGRYTRCSTAHILIYSFEKDPNLSRVKCRDLFLVGTFCSRLQSENVGFLLSDIEMGGDFVYPRLCLFNILLSGGVSERLFSRQSLQTASKHTTASSNRTIFNFPLLQRAEKCD